MTPNDDTDRDITLFIACYNEEQAIIATLETVLAALAESGAATTS